MPPPERVLHVIHTYPPDSAGGIETYLRRLVAEQHRAGIQVTVLTGREGQGFTEPVVEDQLDGISVLRLGSRSRDLAHIPCGPVIGQTFDDVVAAGQFDLVHLHHWHNVTGDLTLRCGRLSVPVVVTLHDFYVACPRFFRMRDGSICAENVERSSCVACCASMVPVADDVLDGLLQGWWDNYVAELGRAGANFVLSHDQADYYREVPHLREFEFIPVVLPAPSLVPETCWEPPKDGRLHIVEWGGIVEGKGLHVLVEACEVTCAPARLVIHHYGRAIEGDYLDRVRDSARRCELVLHGTFDLQTMRTQFPRYDFAVFPSLFRETYGYVVDEAMLLGLPVVVSGHGAPPARIGDRGLVFAPGDVAALAQILDGFLTESARLDVLRSGQPGPLRKIEEHWGELRGHYAAAVTR